MMAVFSHLHKMHYHCKLIRCEVSFVTDIH